ncbi:hypothetical protein U0070_015755 [Myodes glareolus]|uniref:Uncharacterized protein n=1 Tax=Myodes glareolus TaxID=447135 RepID=A0AAW0I6E6_MYOGA
MDNKEGSPQPQHELTIPQWRTSENPRRGKHPLTAELRVTAEGQELILDLEKNDPSPPGLLERSVLDQGLRGP